MTRQFHARARRALTPKPTPNPRDPRPHTLSFKCFRFVSVDEPGSDVYEIIELCDPRNAMRVLVFER
jgi:hypothetical protein